MGELEDTDMVAASFNKNTYEHAYQVYSHRNPENLPLENGRTFYLCPENEDLLRTVLLDRDGFHSQEVKK